MQEASRSSSRSVPPLFPVLHAASILAGRMPAVRITLVAENEGDQQGNRTEKSIRFFDVNPCTITTCGRNSVVECQLPKLDVAGSSPAARLDLR